MSIFRLSKKLDSLLCHFKMLFVIKPDIFCIPCKMRVCKFSKNSMDVNYMYRCHPYHFMEICKPPINEPIGSYQIHHLKWTDLSVYSYPVRGYRMDGCKCNALEPVALGTGVVDTWTQPASRPARNPAGTVSSGSVDRAHMGPRQIIKAHRHFTSGRFLSCPQQKLLCRTVAIMY